MLLRFISLLMFVGALMAMIQPFDNRGPIDLATLEENALAADDAGQSISITPASHKQRSGSLYKEPKDSLALIKANQPVRHVIAEASTPPYSFSLAGLSSEQNQIIMDGIAKASLDKR